MNWESTYSENESAQQMINKMRVPFLISLLRTIKKIDNEKNNLSDSEPKQSYASIIH